MNKFLKPGMTVKVYRPTSASERDSYPTWTAHMDEMHRQFATIIHTHESGGTVIVQDKHGMRWLLQTDWIEIVETKQQCNQLIDSLIEQRHPGAFTCFN